MRLHHDTLTSGARPEKAIAFLHGILGTRVNLRSHARRFVERRPEFLALLVDLRAHGQSQAIDGADTVAAAAMDVIETAAAIGHPLAQVVGHSFGGKVALCLLGQAPELERVVTIDSAPGPRLDARGSEATVRVLGLLEALIGPWKSRDAFIAEVEARGESRSMASWLAMNLAVEADRYVLRLELGRIRSLLDSYLALDAWPMVEAAVATGRTQVDLVIANGSLVYSPEDRARAAGLASASPERIRVQVLEGGHWLHVENPSGVDRVLWGDSSNPSPSIVVGA